MDPESNLSDLEVPTPSAEPWRGRLVHWQDRTTWFGALETWLEAEWRPGAKARLRKRMLDLCWDDSDWLDALERHVQPSVETLVEGLADDLAKATLRTFHGCRVPDAGVFHREGLRRNNPAELEALARRLVAEDDDLAWMRPKIEAMIAEFDDRERDTGRLYVCADERPQLDHSGHYLLFGSEWLQCLLGWGAHRALKRYGTPTVVEVDLPFDWASEGTRREFARHLLQEWTRVFVMGETFSPALDFSVILRRDIPAEKVVGHSHPRVLKNPFMQYLTERTADPTCPHCVSSAKA